MKISCLCSALLAAGLTGFAFTGCTSNPFGEDDIGSGKRAVSGKVLLNDGSTAEGIYIWLETFNIGTRAGNTGQFTLSLPPPSAQGGGGGVDGAFSLYFYVANYQLERAQVATRGGEFIFDKGDINAKGELKATKSLKKTLQIQTQVAPSVVPSNYQQRIGVQLTLQATVDSVTVRIPSVGGLLNSIFFRNILTGEVFEHQAVYNAPYENLLIGTAPQSRFLAFTLGQIPSMTVGTYEVLPYLLLAHDAVPPELMTSIAPDANSFGPGYLKLPFRRDAGKLQIVAPE
jgi:hypothetical protein